MYLLDTHLFLFYILPFFDYVMHDRPDLYDWALQHFIIIHSFIHSIHLVARRHISLIRRAATSCGNRTNRNKRSLQSSANCGIAATHRRRPVNESKRDGRLTRCRETAAVPPGSTRHDARRRPIIQVKRSEVR